jgi:hypothetical protein
MSLWTQPLSSITKRKQAVINWIYFHPQTKILGCTYSAESSLTANLNHWKTQVNQLHLHVLHDQVCQWEIVRKFTTKIMDIKQRPKTMIEMEVKNKSITPNQT